MKLKNKERLQRFCVYVFMSVYLWGGCVCVCSRMPEHVWKPLFSQSTLFSGCIFFFAVIVVAETLYSEA